MNEWVNLIVLIIVLAFIITLISLTTIEVIPTLLKKLADRRKVKRQTKQLVDKMKVVYLDSQLEATIMNTEILKLSRTIELAQLKKKMEDLE
tara:strand:+ start:347 stop:622 length:276 start_codon:yes stop_codon:yes gene_type:complete